MIINTFNRRNAEKSFPAISEKIESFLALIDRPDQTIDDINVDPLKTEIRKLLSEHPTEFVTFTADIMSSTAMEENNLPRATAILLIAETYASHKDVDLLGGIHLRLAKIFKAAGKPDIAYAYARDADRSGCSWIMAQSKSLISGPGFVLTA